MTAPDDPNRVIRASELGQYAYCRKSWWLSSVDGVASSNTEAIARGEQAHQQHGQGVWWGKTLRRIALLVLVAALLVLGLNLGGVFSARQAPKHH